MATLCYCSRFLFSGLVVLTALTSPAHSALPLNTHGLAILGQDGAPRAFFQLPHPPTDLAVLSEQGYVIITTHGPVLIVGKKGRIVSSLPWERMDDVDLVDRDGTRLLLTSSEQKSVCYTGARGQTTKATTVFLEGPTDTDLLANGHLLITDAFSNRVLEVDRYDRVVWEYSHRLSRPRDAERLEDGTTLIADSGHGRLLRVDSSGAVVERITGFQRPARVTVTPNEDILVADSVGGRIVVLKRDGARFVRAENLPRIVSAAPLKDGTLAAVLQAGFHRATASETRLPIREPSTSLVQWILLAIGIVALAILLSGLDPSHVGMYRAATAIAAFLLALSCQYILAAGQGVPFPWLYLAAVTILSLVLYPPFKDLQRHSPLSHRLRNRLDGTGSSLGLRYTLWGFLMVGGGVLCFLLQYRLAAYSTVLWIWTVTAFISLYPLWRVMKDRRWRVDGKYIELLGFRFFVPLRIIEDGRLCDSIESKCNTVLLIVFISALFILTVQLAEIPVAVHGDGAEVALEGIELRNTHPFHFFRLGWYDIPALFFLYPAAVMHWLGDTVWGMRMSDVFMGLLTLPFLYGALRRLWDSRVAVVGTALMAGCAYYIHFSRIGVGYIQTTFWTVAVLYLFLRAVESGAVVWYGLTGLAIGVSFYTYQASRILGVLVVLSWLVLCLKDRRLLRVDWSRFLTLLAAAWFVLSPLLGHFARYPYTLNSRARDVTVFGEIGRHYLDDRYGSSASTTTVLAEQVRRGLGAPVAFYDRSPYLNNRGYEGMLEPVTAIFFLCGIILATATIQASASLIPFLWLLPVLVAGGVMTINTPSYQRYVGVLPFLFFFATPALVAFGSTVVSGSNRQRTRTVVVTVLVLFACFSGVDRYFHGMMQLKQPVDEWTRIARYVEKRGPSNYTYLFGKPKVIFDYATIRFIAKDCDGEDVSDPDRFLSERVDRRGPVSFVFVAENVKYVDRVREVYPDGVELRHFGPRGGLAFVSYHTAL